MESEFSPSPAILVTPWLWFPLATLFLGGLLFVSFRRQRAIHLYHSVRSHLGSLSSRSRVPAPAPVHLGPGAQDSDDDDDDDELLPFSVSADDGRHERYASLARRSRAMLDNLVNNVSVTARTAVDALGWTRARGDGDGDGPGWKRWVLGKRDVDRGMGGIRLG
ncbi:hypothetical protein JCM11491_005380 [Sporobolomyces phaffii]